MRLSKSAVAAGLFGLALVFTEPDGSFRSAQIEDPDGNVIQLFE